jgi:hypothetical protein
MRSGISASIVFGGGSLGQTSRPPERIPAKRRYKMTLYQEISTRIDSFAQTGASLLGLHGERVECREIVDIILGMQDARDCLTIEAAECEVL